MNVLDDNTLAIIYVYNILYFFLEPIKSLQILQLEQELQTNKDINGSEKRESIESWANKVEHDFDEPFITMVNNQNMIGHREGAPNGEQSVNGAITPMTDHITKDPPMIDQDATQTGSVIPYNKVPSSSSGHLLASLPLNKVVIRFGDVNARTGTQEDILPEDRHLCDEDLNDLNPS